MSLTFTYSTPTTPAGAGWADDLGTDTVRLGTLTGLIQSAEAGTVAVSGWTLDDPGSSLEAARGGILGLKRLYVTESTCPANRHYVFNGWLGTREYRRGDGDRPSLRVLANRQITPDLVDTNSILSFRIITDTDGERPAETLGERLTWLLASDYLSTVNDNGDGYVLYDSYALEAADLRGQTAYDVLHDMAARVQFNFYAFYDEVAGNYGLWFAPYYTALRDAVLSLTNYLPDVNGSTIFAVEPDATEKVDPSRVYSGVYLTYDGGAVYEYDYATAYRYGFRDVAMSAPNVKTEAEARKFARTLLDAAGDEAVRITCTALLPAAHVNDFREGERAQVYLTHLPSVQATYTWCRCLRRTVAQVEKTDEFFRVQWELEPIPTPFHQVVLGACNAGGTPIPADGTYAMEWTPTGGGVPPTDITPAAAVIQDTDNYADGQTGNVTYVKIPPNLGGTYRMVQEAAVVNNAWWIIGSPPDPNPQLVTYVSGGGTDSNGAGVAGNASWLFEILRNSGTVIASASGSHGGGLAPYAAVWNIAPTNVVLHAGDIITWRITFAGEWAFTLQSTAYGNGVPGENLGVFALTFLHA